MKKEKILIYYSGSLGDLLIMVPVFSAIRNAHKDSEITLFNIHDSSKAFTPVKVIENTGLVDHLQVWNPSKVKLLRKLRFLLLFCRPFLTRYKIVYYCGREGILFQKRSKRDSAFLRAYCPGTIIRGAVKMWDFTDSKKTMPRICDIVLARINKDGIAPHLTAGENELYLTMEENAAAAEIFRSFDIPQGKIPLAVGPGGKKSVCRYPVKNYIEVLLNLVKNDNVFPVFFGGREDDCDISAMCKALGTGNFARADHCRCNLRTTIALLGNFSLYLGNDTGTLHMAAAAKLPCVVVSSSHNNPGLWAPLGDQHVMLRSDPECSGCRKKDCPIAAVPPCLEQLTPEFVLEAVRRKLKNLN